MGIQYMFVKSIAATMLAILISCVLSMQAQESNSPYEIGLVYYLGDGSPKPLVKETAAQGGRSNYSAKVSGAHSSFRLRAGQAQVFQVCGVDPSRFKLFRFKSEKNSRSLVIAKTNMWIGGTKVVASDSEVPVTIKAAQSNCFTLMIKETLGSGEFGFSPAESTDAFMFGVGDVP